MNLLVPAAAAAAFVLLQKRDVKGEADAIVRRAKRDIREAWDKPPKPRVKRDAENKRRAKRDVERAVARTAAREKRAKTTDEKRAARRQGQADIDKAVAQANEREAKEDRKDAAIAAKRARKIERAEAEKRKRDRRRQDARARRNKESQRQQASERRIERKPRALPAPEPVESREAERERILTQYPGYDPDKARRTAKSVANHLRKRGRPNYSRKLLRDWQALAAIVVDGLYGGGTRGALQYYGVADPPEPYFKPTQTRVYVPPEKR